MMTAGPTENALVAPTANAFRSTQRQPLLLDVAVRRDPAIVDSTRVFDVAALLEVRIEDRLADRAPARLRYLGESAVSHKLIR
jgi:hypothetical protein